MENNTISIIDNKFEIIRYECIGYMNNICNYDKKVFNLNISYELNGLEGGSCKTIYNFEIINKSNLTKSIIEYIEDYSYYKYYIYYEYDSNQNKIIKTKDKNKNKCIIL